MNDKDTLIDLVSSVSGEEYLKVEEDLGEGFVRLRVSEAERRQAKHDIRGVEDIIVELLRNSRDSHARQVFVASWRDIDTRHLIVIDDGLGIPSKLQDLVFEPRVTSKLETMRTDRWGIHGRGMALFSIRANVTEAAVAASEPNKGTAICIRADTVHLPERADQSTWPMVTPDPDGALEVVRGPHNIIRKIAEFACEHPDIHIYLGTPTEIVTTLCALTHHGLGATDLMFANDPSRFPIWQRPATASDASEMVMLADTLRLPISERTAHRILADELVPLETVAEQLSFCDDPEPETPVDIYSDQRSLRIHHTDLDDFKRELQHAFDTLSDRYYLNLKGEPRITVGKHDIRVRFQIDKEE